MCLWCKTRVPYAPHARLSSEYSCRQIYTTSPIEPILAVREVGGVDALTGLEKKKESGTSSLASPQTGGLNFYLPAYVGEVLYLEATSAGTLDQSSR